MKLKNAVNACLTKGKAAAAAATGAIMMAITYGPSVYATGEVNLESVTAPIIGLITSIRRVAIPLVAAVGGLYCVLLGVKYAKAEEPQDREKAKQHLKSAIIGFVLIFILIVALGIATPILIQWMETNG